ncbi:hypothetical protein [Polaromonas sp.]|uniref:hypothetical protein n=1 Tax=Polaromonas sp. TaxID=1869339 RepID=UPI002FC5DE21
MNLIHVFWVETVSAKTGRACGIASEEAEFKGFAPALQPATRRAFVLQIDTLKWINLHSQTL